MANWREEYFAALSARDTHEKANAELYDAYTQLADRAAGRTTLPLPSSSSPQDPPPPPVPSAAAGKKPSGNSSTTTDLQTLLSTTRTDLSLAQKSRAELATHLARTTAELEALRNRHGQEVRRAADLAVERRGLQLRLRDRDEELRGKAKLLDSVQDELVSLNLQFNMAEDKAKRIEKENKELVDRWMTRMGQEAEAMNKASKFS